MELRKGDSGYDINFAVKESDGTTIKDLSLIDTIKFQVRDNNNGRNVVNGACTVVSAVAGTCKYAVGADDFTKNGSFEGGLQLQITSPVKKETSDEFSVIVKDSLI